MALVRSRDIQYFSNEEKQIKVYEYIDKLIPLFPDFDYCHLSDKIRELEPDFEKRKKITSIITDIIYISTKLGYIQHPPGANGDNYELTDIGRLVKQKGGHFKYQRNQKLKKVEFFKILPIILTIIGLVLAYKSYNLNVENNQTKRENEVIKKENYSLKQQIKILQNKKRTN